MVFGVAHCGVAYKTTVFGGEHVDVYLFDLLFFVEVGYDSLGAQSD